MNRTKQYLNNLVNKIITETLQDKADEVMEKIKSNEFDYVAEGEMCECGSPMVEGECKECGKMSGDMMEKLYGGQRKLDKNKNGKIDAQDFKMLRGEMDEEVMYELELDEDECTECGEMREGETCEECGGGEFYEGECVECGMVKGEMYELEDPSWFEDTDEINRRLEKQHKKDDKDEDFIGNIFTGDRDADMINMVRDYPEFANRYDQIKRNREMEEGNAFSGAREKAIKAGRESFNVDGKTYPVKGDLDETLYRLVDGEDSALFTENEIIDIIENIVKEEKEKDNIKKGVQHKGLSTYEKAYKGSGKENKEYLDSVAKKMTDYIKDGSKGKYETNPKHFPKGNGQLAKMDKKAYEVSTDGEEFIDDYLRPGMQTLDYDEMHPNEEWMDDIIQGSSRTGNSDEYANAEQTEVNKKLNKTRKKGAYNKAKRAAYNKAPQPVISDKPGQENGKGLHIKTEGIEGKQKEKLTEEFKRIQELMGYTQKTQ